MKHKKKLIAGGILLFLIFTNPTMRDFKDFVGNETDTKRINNFLLFSIYSESYSTQYIGICKNFFEVPHTEKETPVSAIEHLDSISAAMAQDSMAAAAAAAAEDASAESEPTWEQSVPIQDSATDPKLPNGYTIVKDKK